MSQKNVELARRAFEAVVRGEVDELRAFCRVDIEIRQPPEIPDAKTYRGPDAVRQAFVDWPSQWDSWRLVLLQIEDVDDSHVIVAAEQHVSARGIDFHQPVLFALELRDGLIARTAMFLSEEAARADVNGQTRPS